MKLRGMSVVLALAAVPSVAHATWSVVALDRATKRVVIGAATCVTQGRFAGFPAQGLMDIQAIVVPGVGIAAAQAGVDRTRANQMLVYNEMKKGTHPSEILKLLMADSSIQSRQFGMVDMQGRFAGFSGARNGKASSSVQGQVMGTEVYYAIQGNILASNAVVQGAVRAFEAAQGTIEDRVMAAMDAAEAAGGDSRCTCATTPRPQTALPCVTRTAHVAYLLAADSSDAAGVSFNDGKYSVYLNVTDENTTPQEDPSPVRTLRLRYDAWRKGGRR
ncbi:MAG: DUF1028 domain-containing protein [Gemmatimonadetes bacterium]|nr:DUF1028 domain-containing protein [Gemmatimonadota bacterium]